MYILSPAAIKALMNDPILRAKLMITLDLSANSIYRIYSGNEINNDLTKYAALEVISEESGLATKKILVRVTTDIKKKVAKGEMQT